MFIRSKYSGYEGTEQVAAGDFLLLCCPQLAEGEKWDMYTTRAHVKYVRMEQFGHFMMGSMYFPRHKVSVGLSGTYGGDGLISDVPRCVWEDGIPVPRELIEAWGKGGGWNSAGSEGKSMRQWALETFPPSARMRNGGWR